MLFYMEENKGEDLRREVQQVFSAAGEKPVIEQAERIRRMEDNRTRAVRLRLTNRIAALSVVRKASLLKGTKKLRVYRPGSIS